MLFKFEEDENEVKIIYDSTIMHFPKHLYYSEQDMWVRVGEFSGIATVGLTDYIRTTFGNVTSLEIDVDLDVIISTTDEIGSIKFNKTKFKIFPPVSGNIITVNEAVREQPDLIKSDNYEQGWLFKINPNDLETELRNLCINAKYYAKVVQERIKK